MRVYGLFFLLLFAIDVFPQDSLPLKIHHAEPVNVDLIRDLGARKGEKEWNLGWGFGNTNDYFVHSGFVEYEFAPVNRLGLEVEVPFHFYQPSGSADAVATPPNHRVDGMKLAAQYTFLVSAKARLSMAVGYIHEFGLYPFKEVRLTGNISEGMLYNPIFIMAKKWGNLHTLLYTGPKAFQHFHKSGWAFGYEVNFSTHYTLPGTGNFIGLESNIEYGDGQWGVVLHPQTKLKLGKRIALGLATGIPTRFNGNGISFIARLIYEPK